MQIWAAMLDLGNFIKDNTILKYLNQQTAYQPDSFYHHHILTRSLTRRAIFSGAFGYTLAMI